MHIYNYQIMTEPFLATLIGDEIQGNLKWSEFVDGGDEIRPSRQILNGDWTLDLISVRVDTSGSVVC